MTRYGWSVGEGTVHTRLGAKLGMDWKVHIAIERRAGGPRKVLAVRDGEEPHLIKNRP
jgi:hypothetical protein